MLKMRCYKLVTTIILLCMSTSTNALEIMETLPKNAIIDGELTEWIMPPTLLMNYANQVAGKNKIQDDNDFSANIWIAFSAKGLVVAGDVSDDLVLFPQDDSSLLSSDHVEIWLSFPEAEMPPLGYVNQLERVDVKDKEWCNSQQEDRRNACFEWVVAQQTRRRILKRLFTNQYAASSLGVKELYLSEAHSGTKYEFPFTSERCCKSAKTAFVKTERGYRFELFIPDKLLPAVSTNPLASFRLLVDINDNDESYKGMESFVSSSDKRQFGKPDTFNEIALKQPIPYASTSPVFASILKGAMNLFYFPSDDISEIYGLQNIAVGYQYFPEQESPEVVPLKIKLSESLASCGDAKLYSVPFKVEEFGGAVEQLVSLKGNQLIQTHELQGGCKYSDFADREIIVKDYKPCVRAALLCKGIRSITGSGECGACPTIYFEVVSLHQTGEIEHLFTDAIGSSSGYDIEIIRPADGSYFGFSWIEYDEDGHEVKRSENYYWKTNTYVEP